MHGHGEHGREQEPSQRTINVTINTTPAPSATPTSTPPSNPTPTSVPPTPPKPQHW
jgi:hypothetical protein